jgi:hypothetical protein
MQKSEVFDIVNIFVGPFWTILAIFEPKKRGQFFRAEFLAKK